MNGTIQNRDSFLGKIANRLGREQKTAIERPKWEYQPQDKVLQDLSQDELVEILEEQCKNILTNLVKTSLSELPDTLKEAVNQYGGGPIVTTKDAAF